MSIKLYPPSIYMYNTADKAIAAIEALLYLPSIYMYNTA